MEILDHVVISKLGESDLLPHATVNDERNENHEAFVSEHGERFEQSGRERLLGIFSAQCHLFGGLRRISKYGKLVYEKN